MTRGRIETLDLVSMLPPLAIFIPDYSLGRTLEHVVCLSLLTRHADLVTLVAPPRLAALLYHLINLTTPQFEEGERKCQVHMACVLQSVKYRFV